MKGIAATYQIDYNALAAFPEVPAGYYKTVSNWKEVYVRMKHKYSNQNNIVLFKTPSDTAELFCSESARGGEWELESILIRDHDLGEVSLNNTQIPLISNYNFFVQSAATHGDIWVGPGETVVLPTSGKKQYGDFAVEAGGTLELAPGGGITEIEVLENCIINGTIKANKGEHIGGTWNSTSVLSEPLSFSVTQKNGGTGGEGEEDDSLNPGGLGGAHFNGNGGGGGRSAQFVALVGGNASTGLAGLGAGQDDLAASTYGEDGAPSLFSSEAGSGGFRGAHGQGLYIKARKILGTGTIEASGQKGGDGGDGAEFMFGPSLYGNAGGGGGAGGDGGKVWLRYQLDSPTLTVNVLAGDKGNRGLGGFGETEAEHGVAGTVGSVDITTW